MKNILMVTAGVLAFAYVFFCAGRTYEYASTYGQPDPKCEWAMARVKVLEDGKVYQPVEPDR